MVDVFTNADFLTALQFARKFNIPRETVEKAFKILKLKQARIEVINNRHLSLVIIPRTNKVHPLAYDAVLAEIAKKR